MTASLVAQLRPRRSLPDTLPVTGTNRLGFIAGPCVLESRDLALRCAEAIAETARRHGVPAIFKASYDKANRSSAGAYRGPGLETGLRILEEVRTATGLPVLSDVHSPAEAAVAGDVLDVLQVPAFLCRQTDLLLAAAATGRPVQVKKGQFMPPGDARLVAEKLVSGGASEIWLCERGSSFGHGDLVVDMRGLVRMGHALDAVDGCRGRVVFDATHSVQQRTAGSTGGQRELVGPLARAAVAVGVDLIFAEVHPTPDTALSDAGSQLPLAAFDPLVGVLVRLDEAVRAS